MEFIDVVMKRRAVRRFEEGGVERDVIERIARLAQRTPSAGFSQGQRLIVVTEPGRRREVARLCGEEEYEDLDMGPWISECAAQFIPCVSEAIYHRRYQEADKLQDDGTEIDWPIPYWWVDVGATMQNVMLAAVNEGLGCGFVGTDEAGWGQLRRCWASRRSSCRSASCRSGVPCLTSAHRRSSEAGSGSRSSRAGNAGTDPPSRQRGRGRPSGWPRLDLLELERFDDRHRLNSKRVERGRIAREESDRQNVAITQVDQDQALAFPRADGDRVGVGCLQVFKHIALGDPIGVEAEVDRLARMPADRDGRRLARDESG
jgi:hypothetical protein